MSTGGGKSVDGIEESWCKYVSPLVTVKVGVAQTSQLALPLVGSVLISHKSMHSCSSNSRAWH